VDDDALVPDLLGQEPPRWSGIALTAVAIAAALAAAVWFAGPPGGTRTTSPALASQSAPRPSVVASRTSASAPPQRRTRAQAAADAGVLPRRAVSVTPSAPAAASDCEGLEAGTKALGVTGATQKELAASFATVVLGAKAEDTERIDACTVVLRRSGTRLTFAAPGPNGAMLSHASSFVDHGLGVLSVQVDNGHLIAYTEYTCDGCSHIEARLVADEGASPPRTFAAKHPIEFLTPAGWTDRALLLRFLGKNEAVKGVLLVSFTDGDFSAG
jgi:hypothetical protein